MAADLELSVGDVFDDFGSLKWAVELFEKSQKSNYWIRDCRTIEAAQKKGIKRPMKESLVYYNLTWACVKGGRSYDESTRSPRGDCGSYIKVAVSKDGQNLVVKDICTVHNHDTSQETFERMPKQKRLTRDICSDLQDFQKIKKEIVFNSSVENIIQRSFIKKSAKAAKMRKLNCGDLESTKKFRTRPKSFQDFIETLKESEDISVEFMADDKGNMKCLFWQDSVMRTRFDIFPELLIVGCVNNVSKLKTSLVFLVIINGNGESEIVALFLTSSDDVETFTSMMDIFRNHNPGWLRTRTVLASYELKHKCVFRSCFTDASLHMCRSQVLEEMKKDLALEKVNISPVERVGVLSIFDKMAHAQNMSAYDEAYDELQHTGLSKVLIYFNKKWHPIREEWVSGLKTSVHFNNETTSCLDTVSFRVKEMIKKFSPLPHFCQDLQKLLQTIREETDSRIIHDINNSLRSSYDAGSVEQRFSNFLTPYAFGKVIKQLHCSLDLKVDTDICDVNNPISIITPTGDIMVSASSCSCQYFSTSWLPCHHIFAFRRKVGLDLFFEDIAQRWQLSTLKLILQNFRPLLQSNSLKADKNYKSQSVANQSDPSSFHYRKAQSSYSQNHINGQQSEMSQAQKFESLLLYAQRLAQLGSDVPMGKFVKRREVLSRLVETWERGEDDDEPSAPNSYLSTQGQMEDLGLHNVASTLANQIQPFQIHGPNLTNENQMSSFIAKDRPYHVPYHHQQDHANLNMGMMEHISPWPHVVL